MTRRSRADNNAELRSWTRDGARNGFVIERFKNKRLKKAQESTCGTTWMEIAIPQDV